MEREETLEEAAAEWTFETNGHKWSNNDDTAGDNYGSFIAGAKWQAETYHQFTLSMDSLKSAREGYLKGKEEYILAQKRSYSEEEVKQIANFGFNAGRRFELKAVDLDFTFEKWFEQFSKLKNG